MKNLVGRYNLLSHGTYEQNGEFTPTSHFLNGELIYSREGYLSVLIFFNEDSEITRKFLAYSGNYEISSDVEVIHKINVCSQTKRDASEEKRNYRTEKEILFLSCNLDDGKRFEAKWERFK